MSDDKIVIRRRGRRMSLAEYGARMDGNIKDAEIDKLRDAMQFYADPNRYKSTSVHMCGHSTGQSVMIDGGRKAREALGVKS